MSDTAADVIAMLRRHYVPDEARPAGVFAPEIQAPDSTRRADLIWMPTTLAGGAVNGRTELHGHEVKVTRQDVQVELADPTKAEPWAQYCTRWWLVVLHPSLIEGLVIPAAWGVLAPPSGRRTRALTVVREAPHLRPVEQAPAFARLARWQLYGHRDVEVLLRRELDAVKQSLAWAKRQVEDARLAGGLADPESKRVRAILEALEAQTGERSPYGGWTHVNDDHVVRAVLDASEVQAAARQAKHRLRKLVREIEQACDPFRQAHGSLAELLRQSEALDREAS
jgi:hypothetical protein